SGSNSYTGGTSVNGGSLAMIGSNAWSPVLTAPAGTDLKHGALVFDYSNGSTDPSPTIQSVLTTAFASGFASGQIHSSTATPSVGLGWLDDTANSRAVVAYTLFGDAN